MAYTLPKQQRYRAPDYDELVTETTEAQHALSDWHDKTHGLTLWAGCHQEPCSLLDPMFREETP